MHAWSQKLTICNSADQIGNISQEKSMVDHLEVPNAHRDMLSPHRTSVISQDLPDTVANFVDFVKEGHTRHRFRYNMHRRYRGLILDLRTYFTILSNWHVYSWFARIICLIKGSWSTSSSPVRSPSPSCQHNQGPYGTTSLLQRSRSPSPSKSKDNHFRG